MTHTPGPPAPTRPGTGPAGWGGIVRWVALAVPILAIAGLMLAQAATAPSSRVPDRVPDFHLARTDGHTVGREQILAGGPVLFFFSMGPGCGGCFTQIPELLPSLAQRGITLVPVMVDPVEVVAEQARLFGVDTPILVDPGSRLSEAMGMLGVYGHTDRPSHSFALADPDGSIRWARHYAEMFVPADVLFEELDRA